LGAPWVCCGWVDDCHGVARGGARCVGGAAGTGRMQKGQNSGGSAVALFSYCYA